MFRFRTFKVIARHSPVARLLQQSRLKLVAVHLMHLLSNRVMATAVLFAGRFVVGSLDQFAAEANMSARIQVDRDVVDAVALLLFSADLIERDRAVRHAIVGRFRRIIEQLQIHLSAGLDFAGERFV